MECSYAVDIYLSCSCIDVRSPHPQVCIFQRLLLTSKRCCLEQERNFLGQIVSIKRGVGGLTGSILCTLALHKLQHFYSFYNMCPFWIQSNCSTHHHLQLYIYGGPQKAFLQVCCFVVVDNKHSHVDLIYLFGCSGTS